MAIVAGYPIADVLWRRSRRVTSGYPSTPRPRVFLNSQIVVSVREFGPNDVPPGVAGENGPAEVPCTIFQGGLDERVMRIRVDQRAVSGAL